MVVGRLASAMFRFVGSASDDAAAAEVAAALDELSMQAVPDDLRDDTAALARARRLILQNQPLADGILARLLATRVSEQARSLQDHFLAQQRHAELRAWIFRVLLYLASVLLLVYLGLLYVRLRANARALRARSDFEHLIAGISGQLIDTPVERTARRDPPGAGAAGPACRAWIAPTSSSMATDMPRRARATHGFAKGSIVPDGWPDGGLAIGCEFPPPRNGAMTWIPKGMSVMAASTSPPSRHCRPAKRRRG